MELNLNRGNILISGKCGTGKTHMVRNLLNKQVCGEKHKTCIFYLDYHIWDVLDVEKSFRLDKNTIVYGEGEPEKETVSEILHILVEQYMYRNELTKEHNKYTINDCVGIKIRGFRFQETVYMPDDIVKVETENGYNYILAKDLDKYVKNVEFFTGDYEPTTTILVMDECFVRDETSLRLLELILKDGHVTGQKVIKTYQHLEQVSGMDLTLFPTKVELTGRGVGVVCRKGVFSNYEI